MLQRRRSFEQLLDISARNNSALEAVFERFKTIICLLLTVPDPGVESGCQRPNNCQDNGKDCAKLCPGNWRISTDRRSRWRWHCLQSFCGNLTPHIIFLLTTQIIATA